MPFARILGLVFSGFACKAYAIGLALWIASEVYAILSSVSESVNVALF